MLSTPPLGDQEGVVHFHIRWSNSQLDWQVFSSPAEASASAEQLARAGETYTIEAFANGKCLRCAELKTTTTTKGDEEKIHKKEGGGSLRNDV